METVKTFGCLGTTIKVASGHYYDLANPTPDMVTIYDIAHGLSNICRFGGHIPVFYSVAEHSVNCCIKATKENQSVGSRLACLMHDAAEAYIGDIVKPLKVLLNPIYGPIEQANEEAISAKFRIDFKSTKPIWKRIDREMLIAERNAIFGNDGIVWTDEEKVKPYTLTPLYLSPPEARDAFMFHAERLLTVREAKGKHD